MLFLLSGLLAGHQPSNYARDLDAVTTFSAAARSNAHSMQRDKKEHFYKMKKHEVCLN